VSCPLSVWPGFEALIHIATQSADELIAIAEALDDVGIGLPWQGKVYNLPKSFFLVHAMEHGVEHRTWAKVPLASMDIATPDLDG
jgi:hypothetical protein